VRKVHRTATVPSIPRWRASRPVGVRSSTWAFSRVDCAWEHRSASTKGFRSSTSHFSDGQNAGWMVSARTAPGTGLKDKADDKGSRARLKNTAQRAQGRRQGGELSKEGLTVN